MKRFASLYDELDRTTSTNAKVAAMVRYFSDAPAADAAWAVFFLTGRRLKRLVPSAAIREWTLAATGIEGWLLEECYSVVGAILTKKVFGLLAILLKTWTSRNDSGIHRKLLSLKA